ncbi:MAG: aldo/keto reductase [Clostridiales bacterium]|nr:aldo/keto reductase [Clostridiales bacterium]
MDQARESGIPFRILGATAERISIIGVGGHHIGRPADPRVGIRIIRMAIDEGINFLDNAWCYHDGRSEEIMGQALRDGYRQRAFLMTKNHGRDAATFRKQLDESLRRLQTDYVDLLQFHEIIHEGEPDRIFSEGAIEAAVEARTAGKIRYIGFTGHRWPHLFRQMLSHDFAWDTLQMPVNLLDVHFRSFADEIMPIAEARNIGIIGMKGLAQARILEAGVSVEEALGYTLSQPIATLVCGMESVEVLQQNLRIVRDWQPMERDEQARLHQRVAAAAADGHLEEYKTS